MATIDDLKEQSQGLAASARTESAKKLAQIVFELCKKIQKMEQEINGLKSRARRK